MIKLVPACVVVQPPNNEDNSADKEEMVAVIDSRKETGYSTPDK